MKNSWKKVLELLVGTGLMLIESDRHKISRTIRDRVDDWRDSAHDKYDDAVDRAERIKDVLRGRSNYVAPFGSFLIGMGVGVGLGMLFAPAPGEEIRSTLKDQAADLKDRVAQQAANLRGRASERVSQFKDQAREAGRSESSSSTTSPYSRPA